MPDRQRIRGGWPVKSVYPRFNDFRVASYRPLSYLSSVRPLLAAMRKRKAFSLMKPSASF